MKAELAKQQQQQKVKRNEKPTKPKVDGLCVTGEWRYIAKRYANSKTPWRGVGKKNSEALDACFEQKAAKRGKSSTCCQDLTIGQRKAHAAAAASGSTSHVANLRPRLYLEKKGRKSTCGCTSGYLCKRRPYSPLRWEMICQRATPAGTPAAAESEAPMRMEDVRRWVQRNVPQTGTAEWTWKEVCAIEEVKVGRELRDKFCAALRDLGSKASGSNKQGIGRASTLCFHGTSLEAARRISKNGFDPAFRKRQQLGDGEYFSLGVDSAVDFAMQAEQRAPKKAGSPASSGRMVLLVCEVITGAKTVKSSPDKKVSVAGDYMVVQDVAFELPRAIVKIRS